MSAPLAARESSWMHARTLTTLTMAVTALVAAAGLFALSGPPARRGRATRSGAASEYGRLPLAFEANRGQTDARARFVARGAGYNLFLTARGPVLALKHNALAMRF